MGSEITPIAPEDDLKIELPVHLEASGKDDAALESAFAHLSWQTTIKLFWRNIILVYAVYMGAMFDGYGLTTPKSIAANKTFIAAFGTVHSKTGVALNAQYVAAWSGIQAGMIIIGLVVAAFLSDRFGRKPNMWIMCGFFTSAILLGITAKNWWMFLISRGFTGIGVGFCQATLTCYVAEVAPAGLRGNLLTGYAFMLAVGQLAGNIALYIIQQKGISWRAAFYSEIVFLGLFLPVAIFCPESPWYYANRFEHEKAKRSLKRLNGSVPGYDVEHEYAVMSAQVEHNAKIARESAAASFTELFRGVNLRRSWISVLPLTTQQWTGLPLVFTYLAYFFSLAGVANPFIPTLAQAFILLGFVVIAALAIEKVGRRRLLLVSESVCFLSLIFMGVIGHLAVANDGLLTASQSTGITVLACTWVAGYAMGPASLGYVFIADTATPLLRAKTTGIAAAFNSAFGLILNYCTPFMLSAQSANWGIQTAFFYAPLCLIGILLIYFTVPEVKGRSHAELDELFERRIPTRKFESTKTSAQLLAEGQVISTAERV